MGDFTSRTWCGSPLKYSSTGLVLTVIFPSPFGSRRTCAIAFLRRPVARISSLLAMSLHLLLEDGMGMLVVDVDLQAHELLAREAVLRQHPTHGEHQDAARVALHLALQRRHLRAAGV